MSSLTKSRITLNRIICPRLSLEEFFKLAAGLGLAGVELRNDLPGGRIIDDCSPEEARGLADRYGIEVLTVNALQQFNLGPLLKEKTAEVQQLVELAGEINCRAVVLCPNNDTRDARNPGQMYAETVTALKAFGPLFEAGGAAGYVEPLGFSQSSLASLLTAQRAIEESGFSCYRMVFDTFHHFLGPDTRESLERGLDVRLIGIVHASGTEIDLPAADYQDEHRGLVLAEDRLKSKEQIELLLDRGYEGQVAFEPFAARVQALPLPELTAELERSIAYLTGES
jgi:2-keto-myo-inositol isomerase